jgi:hypothetical protein
MLFVQVICLKAGPATSEGSNTLSSIVVKVYGIASNFSCHNAGAVACSVTLQVDGREICCEYQNLKKRENYERETCLYRNRSQPTSTLRHTIRHTITPWTILLRGHLAIDSGTDTAAYSSTVLFSAAGSRFV